MLFVVHLRYKQLGRRPYVCFRTSLNDKVEIDQITIDIAQQVTGVICVEEHRTGTDKGLDQALALGQVLSQGINQFKFTTGPLEKGSLFFLH